MAELLGALEPGLGRSVAQSLACLPAFILLFLRDPPTLPHCNSVFL